MKTAKNPFRHFPYKHPTFGTARKPKGERYWKSSVYYWWWAYLKRNQEYLKCCESGGKGKLNSLYQDFGDVRSNDFKAWWFSNDRGANLFAEPPMETSVVIHDKGDVLSDSTNLLTISFPLNLPRRFLQKRFNEILKVHHKGERGHQMAKRSDASYKVNGQPNVPSLELGLKVYDAYLAEPNKSLWEIGNETPNVLKVQKIKATDDPNVVRSKKRALAITVSRYIKRVEGYIANTGLGIFP